MLAGDAILNYRTVASFAHEERIVERFKKLLEAPVKKSVGQHNLAGLAFGFSQFMTYFIFGGLFWAGFKIMIDNDQLDPADVFIAIFAMMFGASAGGQA